MRARRRLLGLFLGLCGQFLEPGPPLVVREVVEPAGVGHVFRQIQPLKLSQGPYSGHGCPVVPVERRSVGDGHQGGRGMVALGLDVQRGPGVAWERRSDGSGVLSVGHEPRLARKLAARQSGKFCRYEKNA